MADPESDKFILCLAQILLALICAKIRGFSQLKNTKPQDFCQINVLDFSPGGFLDYLMSEYNNLNRLITFACIIVNEKIFYLKIKL